MFLKISDFNKLPNCNFDESKHEYTVNGKVLLSVTQLLKKHGIAPDYSFVNKDLLELSARRGTAIHKEIENYIDTGDVGFSEEFYTAIELLEQNGLTPIGAEIVTYNDITVGTIDLICTDGHGRYILIDTKTTSTIHKQAVAWQLSIYKALAETQYGIKISGLMVLHFPFKAKGKLVGINPIPPTTVSELLDSERKDESYEVAQVVEFDESLLQAFTQAENHIVQVEQMLKTAKEQAEEYRKQIFAVMKSNNVKSLENDRLQITVKDAYNRTTVDSKKLQEEYPTIYTRVLKTSTVGATLLIKVKENEQTL